MHNYRKKYLLNKVNMLMQANTTFLDYSCENDDKIMQLLAKCQETAIDIGEDIEKRNINKTHNIIHMLEEYCEIVYQLTITKEHNVYIEYIDRMNTLLVNVYSDLEKILPADKKEIVFFPYNASMWDSMESIWEEANADNECKVIVVPIPYYDKNRDGTLGKMHYDGDKFPSYVSVVSYEDYNLDKHLPEVAYIHNPYDQYNFVTSIHPSYYSYNIKKYTDCLVYVPYYVSSGGLSEGQKLCSAYLQANYIVIQSSKLREYYDNSISESKFLPLGSPKIDRIIKICNGGKKIPIEWENRIHGKRVIFYNTSIGEMLKDTESFLRKMEYVFNSFLGRDKECLLWRPHPLLEYTFESMRPQYKPFYEALKKAFISSGIGIYDTSSDISNVIAISDAYIGDGASSIVTLFGAAGKPEFILNNRIHIKPESNDIKNEIIPYFHISDNQWLVTQGNNLYYSENNDYSYKYCCSLSDYAENDYQSFVITDEKYCYVCPSNARDILILKNNRYLKRIKLKKENDKNWAFTNAVKVGRFIFLIPVNYPYLVSFNIKTHELKYYSDYKDIHCKKEDTTIKVGGVCVYKEYLLMASPVDGRLCMLNTLTDEFTERDISCDNARGCSQLVAYKNEIWILPYTGYIVRCLDMENGDIREYDCKIKGLKSINPYTKVDCSERPFNYPAINEDVVLLPPCWGNKYIRLYKKTGDVREAKVLSLDKSNSDYYDSYEYSYFIWNHKKDGSIEYYLFNLADRRLYKVDLNTLNTTEISIEFDIDEIKKHEKGFSIYSEWLRYCCKENAVNTLEDFLNGNISGNEFDKNKQLQSYNRIISNIDGTCGKKIHAFIMNHIKKQKERE